MTAPEKESSRGEIARPLRRRAEEMWGRERAEAMSSVIDEVASNMWEVARRPSRPHEAPGFFL